MDAGKLVRRAVETAIETAIQNVWTAVFGVGFATLVALTTWAIGVPEKWAFAVGGMVLGATVVLAAIALVATFRRRHERALERVRKSLYVTGNIGLLDHRRNFEVSMSELQRITAQIAKEDYWIGERGGRAGTQMEKTTSVKKQHRIASVLAGQFHATAARLEKLSIAFDETVVVWSESATAVVNFAPPVSHPRWPGASVAVRGAVAAMVDSAGVAISGQRTLSQRTIGLKGISQDLDGAAERLGEALEAIVVAIEVAERTSLDILAAVDQRLNELPLA